MKTRVLDFFSPHQAKLFEFFEKSKGRTSLRESDRVRFWSPFL